MTPLRPVQLQSVKGDIRFDQVSFAYIEGKEVVHDITFDAPSGSVTALVGTSGSAKRPSPGWRLLS